MRMLNGKPAKKKAVATDANRSQAIGFHLLSNSNK